MSNQYEGTRKGVEIVDQRVEVWQDFFGKDSFPPAQEKGAATRYAGSLDKIIRSSSSVDEAYRSIRGKTLSECSDE